MDVPWDVGEGGAPSASDCVRKASVERSYQTRGWEESRRLERSLSGRFGYYYCPCFGAVA